MMHVPHSEQCRNNRGNDPDYCHCGSREIQLRLDQLEAEREAIEGLIKDAEEITIRGTNVDYNPKMVLAADLEAVLAGRLR
jgi:hypothetical protein